eukprot:5374466-Pyramimonas_sp.AAC.1
MLRAVQLQLATCPMPCGVCIALTSQMWLRSTSAPTARCPTAAPASIANSAGVIGRGGDRCVGKDFAVMS